MRYCPYCMMNISENIDICPRCKRNVNGAAPSHHIKPGTVLNGKYAVGMSLGEGGFGITYLGKDITLDMEVAIKEFYPASISIRNHANSNEVTISTCNHDWNIDIEIGRFLDEGRKLAKFREEQGVVNVLNCFQENGTAYIVMEYISGITLKEYLKRNGIMSLDSLLPMMEPVFRALEKIHSQNLIHRDISPDNMMVMDDGKIKLLDFGAARTVDENKSLSVILKRGYAPYEQYHSKGNQGPWTDVYALCATIYYCITNIVPDESVGRLVADTLKKPSDLGIKISDTQERALMQGLAVRTSDRIQSVDELWKKLGDTVYSMTSLTPNDSESGRTIADKPFVMQNAEILSQQTEKTELDSLASEWQNSEIKQAIQDNTDNPSPQNEHSTKPLSELIQKYISAADWKVLVFVAVSIILAIMIITSIQSPLSSSKNTAEVNSNGVQTTADALIAPNSKPLFTQADGVNVPRELLVDDEDIRISISNYVCAAAQEDSDILYLDIENLASSTRIVNLKRIILNGIEVSPSFVEATVTGNSQQLQDLFIPQSYVHISGESKVSSLRLQFEIKDESENVLFESDLVQVHISDSRNIVCDLNFIQRDIVRFSNFVVTLEGYRTTKYGAELYLHFQDYTSAPYRSSYLQITNAKVNTHDASAMGYLELDAGMNVYSKVSILADGFNNSNIFNERIDSLQFDIKTLFLDGTELTPFEVQKCTLEFDSEGHCVSATGNTVVDGNFKRWGYYSSVLQPAENALSSNDIDSSHPAMPAQTTEQDHSSSVHIDHIDGHIEECEIVEYGRTIPAYMLVLDEPVFQCEELEISLEVAPYDPSLFEHWSFMLWARNEGCFTPISVFSFSPNGSYQRIELNNKASFDALCILPLNIADYPDNRWKDYWQEHIWWDSIFDVVAQKTIN